MTSITSPDYRLRLQDITEIRDAGKREAAGLLVALASTSGDPATLLSEALGEIIGLAVENRIEESTARLEGFCEVIGPILADALNTVDPEHSNVTEPTKALRYFLLGAGQTSHHSVSTRLPV